MGSNQQSLKREIYAEGGKIYPHKFTNAEINVIMRQTCMGSRSGQRGGFAIDEINLSLLKRFEKLQEKWRIYKQLWLGAVYIYHSQPFSSVLFALFHH